MSAFARGGEWDIVVAGAGHNSLLTAAYAARAGFKVLVLEGAAQIGGDTICEELTLPGFVHDSCATAHNLIQSNPLMRNNELQLDRYGLRYLSPDPVFTMPFRDGRSITMWRDLDRTCAELARFSPGDADAYRELLTDWQSLAPIVSAERENPPRPPAEVAAWTQAGPLGDRGLHIRRATALDVIRERFTEEHVRAFFAWIAFMTLHPLDEPETGLLAFSLVAGRQRFSWILPEGGSNRLPLALARIIEDHGGAILTSKPVTRIVVEGGRATGVVTADGSNYSASKAVVSTIHIAHLGGIVGEENLTPEYRAGIARWKPSVTMFVAHYALSEAPRFRTETGSMESVTMGGLESLGSLQRMLTAFRAGRVDLDDPVYLAITPTVIDPSRAPAGKHTFKLVSFLPYELADGPLHWDAIKEAVATRLFERLAPLTTNLSERIVLARHIDSPLDLERRNPANWRGSCHGGASTPDQSGYFRPVEGWSSYRTPVEGLYQTGACTHPGGSVSGLPGRNCAAILLQDLGSRSGRGHPSEGESYMTVHANHPLRPSPASGEGDLPRNRVQVAAHHWRARFVANGIDVNDFDTTVGKTTEWKDWGPNWREVGEVHEALGREAEQHERMVSATAAYQRAAWCYHLGKFLWFEDLSLHGELRDRAVSVYGKTLPHLDPPAERIEIPFESHIIPGHLRRPRDARRPPLILIVPGLDSSKEELFGIEEEFLRRGLATLTIDGPGQSENSVHFPIRVNWESVITPLIDDLERRHDLGVDLNRIGLMGISMGAIYGPRAAAYEKRLLAVVGLSGPYNLGECWDAINPLTKGGYIFYTKSADEAEAKRKAYTLNLEGVLDKVTQPLLVIHGARDGLFPPAQAERIAREAPNATLVMYPDGNHVCNNIAYKYRPLMADWLKERLG